jgi:hypothetical protein
MKLTVERTPYSSVVGGGLTLLNEKGHVAFLVMFMGPTTGISKEQNDALAKQLADWIELYGLEVPDHDLGRSALQDGDRHG